MKQKIRKAFGALSRGQLIRLDNPVPIEYREPVFDPDTIGICCTDGGANSGCDCQDGVTFGYCCSVGGDFTPGETLNCSSFECCPEPPPDPDGTCCSPCPEDGTVNGVKSTTKQSQCSGTWTEGEANCPRCPDFGRCCPPCEGFPNSFGGESTRVVESLCDGEWTDTDDQTCDECPEGGCCCFINDVGEVVSETILGSGAASICAGRDGIFSPGEDCVLVDCSVYSVCCGCAAAICEITDVSVSNDGCEVTLTPSRLCGPVLTDGECIKDAPDGFAGGDCSECSSGPLDDGTENLCGCPCDGFTVDFEIVCPDLSQQTCFNFPDNNPDCVPGTCKYTINVNDGPPCDVGGDCECVEQDGTPGDNSGDEILKCGDIG